MRPGGYLHRCVKDSFMRTVGEGLDDLGWLDVGRKHLPVVVRFDSFDTNESIQMNTVGFVDMDRDPVEFEVGNEGLEMRWSMGVDFYAENDAISLDVTGDVEAILMGHLSMIGRTRPHLLVKDYGATPVADLFYAQLEDIRTDRAMETSKPWQRYWRSTRCTIVYHQVPA